MERSFVLIKPDAFHRSFVGKIISRLEEKGLQLIAAKLIMLDDEILDKQYNHLIDKPFFNEIKDFMKAGPVLVTVWEGVESINTIRSLCGITKSREAEPGSIRGDWGMSIMYNLVHSSDSQENAEIEINNFFNEEEILSYKRIDLPFIYSIREYPKNGG